MKILALALGMACFASNMAHSATHEDGIPQHQVATQTASREVKHEGTGVLKAVNEQAGKVQIAHQPIAALGWPAMTMWFVLRSPLPQELKVGDGVRFEMVQENGKQWVIIAIKHK